MNEFEFADLRIIVIETNKRKKKMEILKPIGNKVLVEVLQSKEEEIGGIVIPKCAQNKSMYARVVEIGTLEKDKKGRYPQIDFEVGNIVIIDLTNNIEIKKDNKTYIIVGFDQVFGIVE